MELIFVHFFCETQIGVIFQPQDAPLHQYHVLTGSPSSNLLLLHLCQKSGSHGYVGLFLDSLFHPIHLCVSPSPNTTRYESLQLDTGQSDFSFFSSFSKVFQLFKAFSTNTHTHTYEIVSLFTRKPVGICVGIVLNLQLNFGKTDIFTPLL